MTNTRNYQEPLMWKKWKRNLFRNCQMLLHTARHKRIETITISVTVHM